MDLDEFEKVDGKQPGKKSCNTGCKIDTRTEFRRTVDGLPEFQGLERVEDWDDYMLYGPAAVQQGRDYYGFHLPHRKKNDL